MLRAVISPGQKTSREFLQAANEAAGNTARSLSDQIPALLSSVSVTAGPSDHLLSRAQIGLLLWGQMGVICLTPINRSPTEEQAPGSSDSVLFRPPICLFRPEELNWTPVVPCARGTVWERVKGQLLTSNYFIRH